MTTNGRLLTVLLVLSALALGGPKIAPSAGAEGELQLQVSHLDTSHFPQVSFLVRVVDQNGRPIPNLTPADLGVRADDKDVRVTGLQSITDAKIPISSLLVVQSSGGMYGQPIAAVRQAAGQYVRSLQPIDEVSLVAFADRVQVLSDFTSDLAQVQNAIGKLNAFGDTALYQAVADSAAAISGRPDSQRLVILVTDGIDFGGKSKVGKDAAIQAVKDGGNPFYVVGIPGFHDAILSQGSVKAGSEIDSAFLQAVADAGGGQLFIAPGADQLGAAFAQITEIERAQYQVSLDFSGSGVQGNVTATVLARRGAESGQAQVRMGLPNIPVPLEEPAAPPPPPKSGGSSWIVLLLPLFVIAGAGYFIARRVMARRSRFELPPPPAVAIFEAQDAPARAGAEAAAPEDAPVLAQLHLSTGETYPLRKGVVTLGVDADCDYRLPVSPGEFGPAKLRVWPARERFVIHDEAPRPRVRVNGRIQAWSMIDEGDEIDVRGISFRLERGTGAPEGDMEKAGV